MATTAVTSAPVLDARSVASGRRRGRARERVARGTGLPIVVSLLPGATLFVVFFVVPLGALIATSFTAWNGHDIAYVGLDNYRELFGDSVFWKAVRNTAVYAAAAVFVQVPLGVIVGIVLSQHPPGWRVFRTLLFLPMMISGAAVALVFSNVFNARYGLLNQALETVGGRGRDWLFETSTARVAIIATFVFFVGLGMILVIAEITSIPTEMYEAATVDGASPLQRHVFITLPMLRNVIGTLVLLALLSTLASFDIVFILTAGGPADATLTITVYAYREYSASHWGYVNAIGGVLVVSGFALIVLVRRLFRIGERDR